MSRPPLRRPFARPTGGFLSRLVWRFQTRNRPRIESWWGVTIYRGSSLKGTLTNAGESREE
jgi:hypothetical protein